MLLPDVSPALHVAGSKARAILVWGSREWDVGSRERALVACYSTAYPLLPTPWGVVWRLREGLAAYQVVGGVRAYQAFDG